MFDLGSQRTYISESLKGKLSLETVRSSTLMIKTFGSTSEQIQECPLVECIVNSRHDNSALCINAYVVPTICAPLNGQIINSAKQEYTHLKGLRLAEEARDEEELQVDVLIGADHYWDFVSKNEKRGDQGSPSRYLHKTVSINLSSTHVLRVETEIETRNSDLRSEVKKFWELESLGIKSEEESVYHKFLKDTEFKGERCEVKLSWKEENELLPDNYKLSINRLNSQLRRLKAKPNVLEEYDRVINEQLKTGVIERVEESTPKSLGKVHYLPHREVVRPEKSTTKLRVVYDASARSNGPSLNDCLYVGPSLLPLLFDILLRFRLYRIALVADIEKAFLNISISEEDRDFLRFLWVNDIKSDQPEVVVYRFSRVVFGVASSPFLLNATLQKHINAYKSTDPKIVENLLQSLYVDDLNSGADNTPEALHQYSRVKEIMHQGGFNMRKWKTDCPELAQVIRETENEVSSTQDATTTTETTMSYAKQVLGSQPDDEKVLGVTWNNSSGTLVFRLDKMVNC